MSFTKRSVVLIAIVLLAGIPVFAQTTASLLGTVTSDGAPLPGVSVTIASPTMQGTRTTVTNDSGSYSFGALPPGTFTVTFELAGLQTVTKTQKVALNVSNRVDADLKVAAVAEAITVTASAPSVLESPQVAANITSTLIDELPIGRTVLATALLAPGVNDNTASGSQLSISGGPGYDNLVMVNGVSITENVRSQALSLFIEDAIQETTVLSGAVSAEWGRFTGGVVNSITKSGGNDFSGSFRDSLNNPKWADERPGETILVDTINETYEGTLGGRIIRDKLWFFLAGRQAETSNALQTFRTNIPYTSVNDEKRYEYKLTGQITPKHNVVAGYLDYKRTITNSRFTSSIYDLKSVSDRKDPQSLLQLHYNGILTNDFLIEAHYSERKWDVATGSGAQVTDLIGGTLMRNSSDGSARFHSPTFCGVCDVETRDNEGGTLKTNYYLSTASMGTHNLVGGYEYFAEHRHANNHQSGSDFRINIFDVVRVGGAGSAPLLSPDGEVYPIVTNATSTNYIRWTPIFVNSDAQNDLKTDSLFVNDRWDLNTHWSFNLGLRYDKNDAIDANGNTASDDSGFSPRLTAIYDLKGDGSNRFTASYNRYVSRIVEGPGTAAESAGSPATIDFRYGGPLINPPGTPTSELLTAPQALAIMWDWFFANGGTDNLALLRPNGARTVPGYDNSFPGSISSPYVDEYVFGYGRRIGRTAFAKFDFIHREWKDFYAYRIDTTTPRITDFLGIGHDVAIVENTNDIERKYNGVQLQAAWKPNRFDFGLNYTWSDLKGNDGQESSTSGTVGNSPIFYPEFIDPSWNNPVGYQSGDQRHLARMWVAYNVPVPDVVGDINLSVLHNYSSGQPYSAAAAIDAFSYPGAPDAAALGYTESQLGYPTYFFSKRGAFRTDDISRTDFSINYARKIYKTLQLFGAAEMYNIFGNEGITAVNTTVYTSLNSQCKKSDGSRCSVFNPFTETPTEGVNWVKGPNFGTPTAPSSYQTARTYSFTVGLRF